jgi:hypothetical protein
LVFTDLPLKTWLPTEFKPRYSGVASATLKWRGRLDTIKDSAGAVTLNLDGTHINNPDILRRLLATKGLRTPDEINFKTAQLDFSYQDDVFQLTRAKLDLAGLLTVNATGALTSPDNKLEADLEWQGLTMGNWLPPSIAEQFSGDINGRVKIHVKQWKLKDGSYAGAIDLLRGQLRYTSVQTMLARFVNDRQLLEIPLTRAHFSYDWTDGVLAVTGIDLRGADRIGIRGDLAINRSGNIAGELLVGTRPGYLKSMAGLGDAVFSRDDAGLRWARVKVSGTIKKPEQDLSEQLAAQLRKHPFALLGLSGKLISWYVGNLFGAEDEWKRPIAP